MDKVQNTKIGEDKLGPNGDAFYELLMHAHEGLNETQSQALNMRLILMLANQIGDIDVLKQVIAAASEV